MWAQQSWQAPELGHHRIGRIDQQVLSLSYFRLKDCDLEHLAKYKNLSMLNLSDNFIVNIKSIKTLRVCGKLKDLELAGNEVEKSPNYRGDVFGEYVFALIEDWSLSSTWTSWTRVGCLSLTTATRTMSSRTCRMTRMMMSKMRIVKMARYLFWSC